MRSTTLIALLPLLAATSTAAAHVHQPESHDDESITTTTPTSIIIEETITDILTRHTASGRTSRKSLSFGPVHKHARFVTPSESASEQVVELGFKGEWDVRDVARGVVRGIPGLEGAKEGEDYYIRKDTYTDPRTHMTHIYIRQLLNGLEVIDGDLNVNVDMGGRVLSFGDNFARIPPKGNPADSFVDHLLASSSPKVPKAPKVSGAETVECRDIIGKIAEVGLELQKIRGGIQQALSSEDALEVGLKGIKGMVAEAVGLVKDYLFGSTSSSSASKQLEKDLEGMSKDLAQDDLESLVNRLDLVKAHLEHLQDHAVVLCAPGIKKTISLETETETETETTLEGEPTEVGLDHGPAEAVIQLLKYLSPAPEGLPTEQEMQAEIQLSLDRDESHFAPPTQGPEFTIRGLPGIEDGGVAGPVQVRLGYHQTTEGGLSLVWRCVLEMKENWYEASVDVADLKVISVADWASDAPPSIKKAKKGGKQKPLPPPKTKGKPYTYTVFPFGVNDPSVGNLSSVHAPWDPVASPAGWHAVPDASNPYERQSIPGQTSGLKGPWVGGYEPKSGEYEGQLQATGRGNGTWTSFATTMGNNVFAQEDWEGASNWLHNARPVNESYIFDYEYGEPEGLRPKEYIDLAVTQLFYTSNMYHDLLYRLGFDELSGNFQMDNFGKGGLGGDAVICQAQDGSGTDNANFMTPPDGSQPRMRMYVWDTATPFRDGDLEAGIVIHEYSHGLSTRLTGGPANSGCLGYGEAGGMGEGWGDAFATLIRQTAEYGTHEEEYGMGSWAANRKSGIRNYVYSANMSSNPSTFKTLDKPGYWGVHAIGEVWAEILFVVEQKLIAKHGFSKTLFPPVNATEPNDYYLPVNSTLAVAGRPSTGPYLVPKHGNTLLAHLLVEGMKLQPCRPSFAAARDAIIQADVVLTGGNNTCDIWKGFAERGLGPEAKTLGQLPWGGGVRSEDYTIPRICGTKPKH